MTIWQGLGGMVYTGSNLSEDTLAEFESVGGSWITPVLYGDDAAGPWNLANLGGVLIPAAHRHNLSVGGWFNVTAGDPEVDATNIAAIVKVYNLKLAILDAEAAYQKNPDVFPHLLKDVRVKLPIANLAVSTNSLNDSLIWNGRGLKPPESARRLGYRVLPQWYNSPSYSGCWCDPVCNMAFLRDQGMKDNFFDPTYLNHRAVALSYVHGTAEVTNEEGAVLETALPRFVEAKPYGLTYGLVLYTLENTPGTNDLQLVKKYRNILYL